MTNQDRSPISPDALERLEELAAWLGEPDPGCAIAPATGSDVLALLSERKALRETLEPFAAASRIQMVSGVERTPYTPADGDFVPANGIITWKALRRAASILGEPKP